MEQASVEWITVTLNDAGEIFDRLIFRAFRCSVHTEPTSPYERKIYLGSVGGGGGGGGGVGGVKLNSMTFQYWEMKFLNFMTFQVFNDLYEPCFCNKICTCCSFDRRKVNLFATRDVTPEYCVTPKFYPIRSQYSLNYTTFIRPVHSTSSSLRSRYLHTMNPDLPFSGQYFTTCRIKYFTLINLLN